MNDRLVMGVVDPPAHIRKELQPFPGGQFFAIAEVIDRQTLDEFHHEIGPAGLRLPGVEHFGDVGVVHHISGSDVEVLIKGGNSQLISLPIERVGSLLRLAYATTVHKAQGQEYHTILMPMSLDHGANLLQRSLLYTAVTRAKEKVYLVGEREAVAVSVSNVSSDSLMCGLHSRF